MAGLRTLIPMVVALFSPYAHAFDDLNIERHIAEEALYFDTQEKVRGGDFDYGNQKGRTKIEIVFQALDDLILDGHEKNVVDAISQIQESDLDLAERLQLFVLKRRLQQQDRLFSQKLKSDVIFRTLMGRLDKKSALVLLSNPDTFSGRSWRDLIRHVTNRYPEWAAPVVNAKVQKETSLQILRDLMSFEPRTDEFADGRYHNKPRVYMFCRTRREQPCIMVMKDRNGQLWHDEKGEVWSQPALAYSRHKKKYNQINGDTPAGIHRIDGVMPVADRQRIFGEFRRLILNFVGADIDDRQSKLLLPESSHDENWWRQASVARDIGRSALRIHGTGRRSSRRKSYYPLVPTSGCVAKRENRYDGVEYFDQRYLLDELMKASGLEPLYENEVYIRALFYLIEINDDDKPVTKTDLENLGLI